MKSSTCLLGLLLAIWGTLSGCQTLEEMAPPISPTFLEVADQNVSEAETLEHGRQIYLTNCAKCHSVEPIGRYSTAHWREIMPRMNKLTKLDDRQAQAVTSYVLSACKVLEQNGVTEKSP